MLIMILIFHYIATQGTAIFPTLYFKILSSTFNSLLQTLSGGAFFILILTSRRV